MKNIRKASVWHDKKGERVDFTGGKVFDHKSKPHKKLKLTQKRVKGKNLPVDLSDWCLAITCVDGTVMHSEIYDTLETGSHVKYLFHNPTGSLLDSNTPAFNP